jgi:hypothetical protein
MDKIVRVYHSLDEMKADEYRYWQSRPVWERMDAVEELNATAYALKGIVVGRLDKTLVSVIRRSER